MTCPNCGGTLVGGIMGIPVHCENKDIELDLEQDSGPHYCNFEDEDTLVFEEDDVVLVEFEEDLPLDLPIDDDFRSNPF